MKQKVNFVSTIDFKNYGTYAEAEKVYELMYKAIPPIFMKFLEEISRVDNNSYPLEVFFAEQPNGIEIRVQLKSTAIIFSETYYLDAIELSSGRFNSTLLVSFANALNRLIGEMLKAALFLTKKEMSNLIDATGQPLLK